MESTLASPQPITHVVLTGFMGAGKTTVGRALARRLGWVFTDLDDAVSQRTGLSVPQIFAIQGEAAFRAAEIGALREILGRSETVIALGGGAPETPEVQHLLQNASGTAVIYLHAPFNLLFERCVQQARDPQATERPLLGAAEAAAERYTRRHPIYSDLAHMVADAASPLELTVEQIFARLLPTISRL